VICKTRPGLTGGGLRLHRGFFLSFSFSPLTPLSCDVDDTEGEDGCLRRECLLASPDIFPFFLSFFLFCGRSVMKEELIRSVHHPKLRIQNSAAPLLPFFFFFFFLLPQLLARGLILTMEGLKISESWFFSFSSPFPFPAPTARELTVLKLARRSPHGIDLLLGQADGTPFSFFFFFFSLSAQSRHEGSVSGQIGDRSRCRLIDVMRHGRSFFSPFSFFFFSS